MLAIILVRSPTVDQSLTTPNTDWGVDSQTCLFEDDGLHVTGAVLCHFRFGHDCANADISISVATVGGDATCASGFFFRAPSDGSTGFYVFRVSANGTWDVAKYSDLGANTVLVAPKTSRAIRSGFGTKNRLRVVMKGPTSTSTSMARKSGRSMTAPIRKEDSASPGVPMRMSSTLTSRCM